MGTRVSVGVASYPSPGRPREGAVRKPVKHKTPINQQDL